MKSKNVVFSKKQVVELKEEQVPELKYGEVLCAAKKSLISIGTELSCLKGQYDKETYWEDFISYPFHPGYSMAAEVVRVGEGVTDLKPGDRISSWTEHQQYFTIHQDDAFLIPETVTDEEATWNTLARTTQLGVRRAELHLGETVGVVGLGMLGQLVVQYLRLMGARKIVAIDPVSSRLDMALDHGATHVINEDINDAAKKVEEITDGEMLDVVFDITGHPDVLAPSTLLLRKLGRLILLGDSTTPSLQHLGPRVVGDSISILGIHGMMYPQVGTEFNPWTAGKMASLFFDYLKQGRMKVSDLITSRCSPMEAPKVYEALLKDRTSEMGVVFDWGEVE
ncbi:zinc-dependent alcohol dehydrogenase [Virgibacillus doumboii]|uniref:zinc-dependent alcohol dehydrogenase n=1 Tax=Virgibacillus doumboii TaxID=2697503 RepID=UPI0013E0DB40|nr:zinc-binding alcohol dehydrogenase [Virgibacillus doumboii]